MEKSESINKIAAALLKAQTKMGGATKDAKNPFFKSNYADLNAVREACIPVLNAEGITVLQPTVNLDGKNYVRTLLLHESGEFLSSDTQVVTNKENDAQSHGSGISYARRYGLQSFLSIGSYDDDGEAAMGRSTGYKAASAQGATAKLPTSSSGHTVVIGGTLNGVQTDAISATTSNEQAAATAANILAPPAAKKWQRKGKAAAEAPLTNGAAKATDAEEWT